MGARIAKCIPFLTRNCVKVLQINNVTKIFNTIYLFFIWVLENSMFVKWSESFVENENASKLAKLSTAIVLLFKPSLLPLMVSARSNSLFPIETFALIWSETFFGRGFLLRSSSENVYYEFDYLIYALVKRSSPKE